MNSLMVDTLYVNNNLELLGVQGKVRGGYEEDVRIPYIAYNAGGRLTYVAVKYDTRIDLDIMSFINMLNDRGWSVEIVKSGTGYAKVFLLSGVICALINNRRAPLMCTKAKVINVDKVGRSATLEYANSYRKFKYPNINTSISRIRDADRKHSSNTGINIREYLNDSSKEILFTDNLRLILVNDYPSVYGNGVAGCLEYFCELCVRVDRQRGINSTKSDYLKEFIGNDIYSYGGESGKYNLKLLVPGIKLYILPCVDDRYKAMMVRRYGIGQDMHRNQEVPFPGVFPGAKESVDRVIDRISWGVGYIGLR